MSTRTDPWPAGTPCWVDLSVPDVQAAVDFYADVIGWTFVDSGPDYGNYHIAQVDGRAAAGVGPIMQEGQPVGLDGLPGQRRRRRHRQADQRARRLDLRRAHGHPEQRADGDRGRSDGRRVRRVAADRHDRLGGRGGARCVRVGRRPAARRRGREALLRRRVRLPLRPAGARGRRDRRLRDLHHRRRASAGRHRRDDGRTARDPVALAGLLHRRRHRRVGRGGGRRRRHACSCRRKTRRSGGSEW